MRVKFSCVLEPNVSREKLLTLGYNMVSTNVIQMWSLNFADHSLKIKLVVFWATKPYLGLGINVLVYVECGKETSWLN